MLALLGDDCHSRQALKSEVPKHYFECKPNVMNKLLIQKRQVSMCYIACSFSSTLFSKSSYKRDCSILEFLSQQDSIDQFDSNRPIINRTAKSKSQSEHSTLVDTSPNIGYITEANFSFSFMQKNNL
ncbi:hypothetical protein BLOT_004763 [Blomia tropicalis]|nr:hypothetical protein BLOT_004763 [Blomia tropicalis]